MRIWHYALLSYLPDAQFKGQLRELVAIMHDWRDKEATNHLLINKVMEYPKSDLWVYFIMYHGEYTHRYNKSINQNIYNEFVAFTSEDYEEWHKPFEGWHTKTYLRMNMANLAEKHIYGIGKSRITDEEWDRLLEGYKQITKEEYVI